MNKLMRFVKDESGVTAIEYGLIAAAIGLMLVVAMPIISPSSACLPHRQRPDRCCCGGAKAAVISKAKAAEAEMDKFRQFARTSRGNRHRIRHYRCGIGLMLVAVMPACKVARCDLRAINVGFDQVAP